MDSDQGKLFIGGISWETSEDKLKDYFSNYGDILQAVIMRDKIIGRPRGFGFVVFADPSVLDAVLQERHTIDGFVYRSSRNSEYTAYSEDDENAYGSDAEEEEACDWPKESRFKDNNKQGDDLQTETNDLGI